MKKRMANGVITRVSHKNLCRSHVINSFHISIWKVYNPNWMLKEYNWSHCYNFQDYTIREAWIPKSVSQIWWLRWLRACYHPLQRKWILSNYPTSCKKSQIRISSFLSTTDLWMAWAISSYKARVSQRAVLNGPWKQT